MDRAAFLRSMAPLFPGVSETEARLQAIEADSRADESGDPQAWQRRHYLAAEQIYLPLWTALAPAYVEALASAWGDGAGRLVVQPEVWPSAVAKHQEHLHALLEHSRLRQAWRDYARWFGADKPRSGGGAKEAEAKQVFLQSCTPLREIPLYQSSLRVSCQQLVCLPVPQWQALQNASVPYRPDLVDAAVVERLATRVAQVFNAPPVVDADLLLGHVGWVAPMVWTTSTANLTVPTNSHGMRDRWEHGWRGDVQPLPADAVAPHWRYEGFYGQLRVTLENGEDWIVGVLAPLHFVRRLAHSVEWYRREARG